MKSGRSLCFWGVSMWLQEVSSCVLGDPWRSGKVALEVWQARVRVEQKKEEETKEEEEEEEEEGKVTS